MRKVLSIIILLNLWIFHEVSAQDGKVSGKVISAADSLPLPGVTVVVKGTREGSVTDNEGHYSIPASPEDTLSFSFVGMQTMKVPVNGRKKIDIALYPKSVGLEEVVVTAMGMRREKKALGYATQEIEGEEVSNTGESDVAKALQGQAAGVSVKQKSGMPGAGSEVRIRGSSSLTMNNEPLYVIDGMPVSSGSPLESGGLGEGTDVSGRSLDLNTEDIKSVNILKGPAAAALYGLRASNGVVVITTKSGEALDKAKQKTRVTIHSNYSREMVSRLPDLQDVYAQGNDGKLDLYTQYSWGPRIDTLQPYQSQKENLTDDSDSPYNYPIEGQPTNKPKVYNNMRDFFQPGHQFKNSVNISTASDLGHFALGFSATNQSGVIPTTGMDKYTAKFKGTLQLAKHLKAGAALNVSNVKVNKVPGGPNESNPLFSVYFAPRSYDLTNKPYEHPDNQYIQKHYRTGADNPYWALEHNHFNEQTQRAFGNVHFNYAPSDWLEASYRVGMDHYTTTDKAYVSMGAGQGRAYPAIPNEPDEPSGGHVKDRIHHFYKLYSNLQVHINQELGSHMTMNLNVGNEFSDIRTNTQSMRGTGVQVGGFDNIMGTNEQLVSQVLVKKRNIGFFGKLELDYQRTLFLSTTGRADVVSYMPSGSRTFFYPSVSLGFVFSELPSLQQQDYLSFGKLRLSYAQVGQAGDVYADKNYYVPSSHSTGETNTDYTFPYQGRLAFSEANVLRTGNLDPQNTNTIEAGFDVRFFQNRIGLDYTFYRTIAEDQIYNVPVARSTGYAEEYRNAGELRNIGHEVMLTLKPIQSSHFEWQLRTNFTTYTNTVKSLARGVERIDVGSQNFESVGTFAEEGREYPVIFGNAYMKDEGQIVVDSRDSINGSPNPRYGMPLEGEPKMLAEVNPDLEMSITNDFTYKWFTLSFRFDWQKGGHRFSGTNALLWAYGIGEKTESREQGLQLDDAKKGYVDESGDLVVKGENDITIPPDQLDVYYDEVLWNITESAVFNTTFFRLREIRLSFDFPEKWINPMFVRSASVYLKGRNLWLLTDYPNVDPEVSTSGGNGIGGFEYIALPNTKSFAAGVKLKF